MPLISSYSLIGLPAVGGEERGREATTRHQPHPRPALLPQLREDLVRDNEAGRRTLQDPLFRALPGADSCPWAAVELAGLCHVLQLPRRE